MKNGDTLLLKKLVNSYGKRVPQDTSIETFNKWKRLKQINDKLDENDKITVIGIDKIADLKRSVRYLDDLILVQ